MNRSRVQYEVSTGSDSDRVVLTFISPMWNDTDIPLACLITFRCQGSWLHGDERGSTNRFHNIYKTPHIDSNKRWQEYNRQSLKIAPLILDSAQRKTVELAIRETCKYRGWHLYAVNVRTNHAHTVVSAGGINGDRVLSALKANATRQMKDNGCWISTRSPWSDKGSKRYLWNEQSVTRAIEYVMFGQGDELPDFDD